MSLNSLFIVFYGKEIRLSLSSFFIILIGQILRFLNSQTNGAVNNVCDFMFGTLGGVVRWCVGAG